MRDIDKISEKVEKRKTQLQPLFVKDKENYDLWDGKRQIFDDHKMSINITGTEMVALSTKSQASLNRSRLDIRVLPPNPLANPDAVKVANQEEDMYYYGFEQADERLANIGEAPLSSNAIWDVIVLGRVPVRVLVYPDKETKEVIWDLLPMTPSFVTFSFDSKGLAWYRYETFRSPSSILEEYKKEVTEDAQGKGVSVSDYWDRKHNVVYLTKAKERLKTWEHPFKEVPAIIRGVNVGPKAITSEGILVTAWGQSIFDHVKEPFKDLNKLRSITATQAHFLAKRPIEEIYEDGTDANLEEEQLDFHPGALLKHPKSIELKSMEISDIPASMMAMMGDISTGIQRATYAALSPDEPGHSGAALRILGQDKQDTLTPGTGTLNSMYTGICKMFKRQILKQELTITVKTVANGVYEVYEMVPELLDNDFHVNAVLVRQDVYDDVEALSRAQMYLQLGLKSRSKVMEEVLLEQDVPNQIAEMTIENIKAAIPEFDLKEGIKIFMNKGMEEEANMAKEHLFLLEAQKRQAVIPPEAQGQPPQGTPTGQPPRPSGVR